MALLLLFNVRVFFLSILYNSLCRWRQCRRLCRDFLKIVNDFQPLIFNKKSSILDFAWVLDPSLSTIERLYYFHFLPNVYICNLWQKHFWWIGMQLLCRKSRNYFEILSSENWKFFVVLGWNQIYWDFILCETEPVLKKVTDEFI